MTDALGAFYTFRFINGIGCRFIRHLLNRDRIKPAHTLTSLASHAHLIFGDLAVNLFPDKYNDFQNLLIDFAKKVGKKDAEVYVKEGKWKARQGGNGLDYARKSIVSYEPCVKEENAFNYDLTRPITEELYELFKPFGTYQSELGNKRLG